MAKTRKTREEKVKSAYRLQNFQLQAEERVAVKDANEFGYLASEYVVADLRKAVIYTTLILLLLWAAKLKLG